MDGCGLRWYKMQKIEAFSKQKLQELRILIRNHPEKEKVKKVETGLR